MDAEKLLQAFTPEETRELAAALPAEVIQSEALRRGIELPAAAGVVAVEGAMHAESELNIESPTPETKESLIENQIGFAYEAYTNIVASLNETRSKQDKIELINGKDIVAELEEWLTEDKLAYMADSQEKDPNLKFTLVAIPNVLAAPKAIINASIKFGMNQPYRTYVDSGFIKKYTAQELSGTNPDNGSKVQFSIIPSKYNPELTGTVAEQRVMLEKLQADNPNLKVPSVLEAITYWQTLRAKDGVVADFHATFISHFDLTEKCAGVWSGVPVSFVLVLGEPYLDDSDVGAPRDGRVSVG